ncbi:MAG: phage holin family protein [Patescibacteria group bacterium]
MLRLFLNTGITFWILSYFVPTIRFANWTALIIASLVMVFIQKIIKPIVKLLFLPINVVTLGLFSIVINVAMLWLVTYLVPGFEITNMVVFGLHLDRFGSILFASILIGFVQGFVTLVI